MAPATRLERHGARSSRRSAPSSGAPGSGRPRCSRARSRRRHGEHALRADAVGDLVEPELEQAARVLISTQPSGRRPPKTSTWCSSVGSWMISASGLGDRLVRADRAVVDAAERDDRRARALRAEARERLRVAALEERRDSTAARRRSRPPARRARGCGPRARSALPARALEQQRAARRRRRGGACGRPRPWSPRSRRSRPAPAGRRTRGAPRAPGRRSTSAAPGARARGISSRR